jgi:hypothetical protein
LPGQEAAFFRPCLQEVWIIRYKTKILFWLAFAALSPGFSSYAEIASKSYVDKAVKIIPAGPAGPKGDTGPSGRDVEFQKSATHIQWRRVGDTNWTDLVPLSDLGWPQPSGAGTYVINVGGAGAVMLQEIEIKDKFVE